MPFTLAHAAAALPFRRSRLIPSAVVVGTFAPDLEYFLRLRPGGGYGHTLPGAFLLSLPLGLVTLFLFHRFIKGPVLGLLPVGLQSRLGEHFERFRVPSLRRFLLIVVSMLVEIATHLIWDAFTHRHMWIFNHLPLLGEFIHLPGRNMMVYQVFQLLSSVAGCLVLAGWLILWYRRTPPREWTPRTGFTPAQRTLVLVWVVAVAMIIGITRASIVLNVHRENFPIGDFGGRAICTAVALAWWQLLAYGVLFAPRMRARERVYSQS